MKKAATILIALLPLGGAHAGELGRLFYTPQQRTQLEAQQAAAANAQTNTEGGVRNHIVVNGIIQRQGGNRIVWINGKQQPAGYGNEKTPGTVPVPVPGKAQPVQLKVGQRLQLEKVAPPQPAVPAQPISPAEDDD